MKFNYSHKAMLLLLCATLVACNKTDLQREPDPQGKEPIVLSVGLDSDSPTAETKASETAVITDGTNKTMQNFDKDASIFMVMKSEYGAADYQGDHTDKYTVSRGRVAAAGNTVTFDSKNQKYWDDAHARSSQLSIWAYASKCPANWYECNFQTPKADWTPIDPETPEHLMQEYEDHKYVTSDLIGWELQGAKGSKGAIYPCIMLWRASHNTTTTPYYRQDIYSVQYQDLLFSNNIADYNDGGHPEKDKRLKFNFGTRKFPQSGEAHMNFYHAMSKITIHIKKGEGFGESFTFTSGNITLKKFNTEGTFNIKDGEFQQIKASYDIPQIYQHSSADAGDAFTLEALAVPNIHEFMQSHSGSDTNSRFVKNNKSLETDVMMEFIIENNKYQITSGVLYDALVDGSDNPVTNATKKTDNGTYIPLEAGKNYVFTFTVGKQKIDHITAQVADWETVTADNITPSNARIKLKLEERGSALTDSDRFALYRAADNIADEDPINDNHEVYNWKTGYNTTGETPSYVAAVSPNPAHWTTSWYWDSNKHFYHFRALAQDNGSAKVAVSTVNTDSGDGDFYTLDSAVSYNDILWGAPMLDDADNETAGSFKWHYGPKTNGFDAKDDGTVASGLPEGTQHQIYKAIGPTEDAVKLTLFHMMSDLTINITTTTGAEKVDLGNGTTSKPQVFLEDSYAYGKVLLGNGLVKTTGDVSDQEIPQNSFTAEAGEPTPTPAKAVYKFGVVPQNLETSVNDEKGVQLRIVTPDKNEYIVDLKNVKATTVGQNNIANPYTLGSDSKYAIDRWYPGYKYTYNFTLKKSQIDKIEVTIVGWETLETENEDVTIQ